MSMAIVYNSPCTVITEGTMDRPMTTKEAAAYLKLKSDSTIRRAIWEGKLVATKPGHDWLIEVQELELWAQFEEVKPRKEYRKRTNPNN
jgi:excisionase family DNA binding protein